MGYFAASVVYLILVLHASPAPLCRDWKARAKKNKNKPWIMRIHRNRCLDSPGRFCPVFWLLTYLFYCKDGLHPDGPIFQFDDDDTSDRPMTPKQWTTMTQRTFVNVSVWSSARLPIARICLFCCPCPCPLLTLRFISSSCRLSCTRQPCMMISPASSSPRGLAAPTTPSAAQPLNGRAGVMPRSCMCAGSAGALLCAHSPLPALPMT